MNNHICRGLLSILFASTFGAAAPLSQSDQCRSASVQGSIESMGTPASGIAHAQIKRMAHEAHSLVQTEVQPFDCQGHGGPLLVARSDSGKGYDVLSYNPATEEFDTYFSIPWSWAKFNFSAMNANAMSPITNMAYGCIDYYDDKPDPVAGAKYLVRFDNERLEYVAKLPLMEDSEIHNRGNPFYFSGAFSEDGVLFLGTGLDNRRFAIGANGDKKPDEMPGFSSPFDAGLTDLTGMTSPSYHGHGDMVSIVANLDNRGEKHYIIALHSKTEIVIVDVEDDEEHIVALTGFEAGPLGGFGSAWQFKDKAFFHVNNGGVYEVLLDSIDLQAKTVTVIRVGSSPKVKGNDGMNCMHTDAPEKWTPPCEDGTCNIWGDPHISGFDKTRVSLLNMPMKALSLSEIPKPPHAHSATHTSMEVGDVWLVKNPNVHVQGRYSIVHGMQNRPFLYSVAIGGPFLRKNALIIEPRNGRVMWKRKQILTSLKHNNSFFDDLINATYRRDSELVQDRSRTTKGIELELPLGIKMLVNRHAKTLGLRIILQGPLQDGIDGQCGNYNGDSTDDTTEMIQKRVGKGISDSELLFDTMFNPWKTLLT